MVWMLKGMFLESFNRELSDDLLYGVSVQAPATLEKAQKVSQRIERGGWPFMKKVVRCTPCNKAIIFLLRHGKINLKENPLILILVSRIIKCLKVINYRTLKTVIIFTTSTKLKLFIKITFTRGTIFLTLITPRYSIFRKILFYRRSPDTHRFSAPFFYPQNYNLYHVQRQPKNHSNSTPVRRTDTRTQSREHNTHNPP